MKLYIVKVEEKVLNQAVFDRRSYNSLRATAINWALLPTPHIRVPAFREQVRDFYKEVSPRLPFLWVACWGPFDKSVFQDLFTTFFRAFWRKKKWKELIAIHNYNSAWQCLWVNGAHISKLPLLSFSHQPLLPSSCKWKVPIALHSRQRQLLSGLWKKRNFDEYETQLSSTFHLKENALPCSHQTGAAQMVACFLPRSHWKVGMAPQSPAYTASGSLTEHFNNSAVATTACSSMCPAMADGVERKSTGCCSSLFQLFLEM